MRNRIGLAAALGIALALAACGKPAAETSDAPTPPELSTGEAMASDTAAPPAGEANTDAMASAPDAARPDFGEPGVSKSEVKK